MSAAEALQSAALFGLHVFCSVVIGDESGEELGSLEMYCGNGRRFSAVVTQPRLGLPSDRWSKPRASGGGRPGASRTHLDFAMAADWRSAMDDSKRNAVKFLEKEIKTYMALSLFLSKRGIEEHVRVGDKKILISPTFYKERMKEAKKIVAELRNSD